MRSNWTDREATGLDPLALRVYSSRLLGSESSLVLYGGGNTSVKHEMEDEAGGVVRVLSIKGSGTDLATIDVGGFSPLALDPLVRLRTRSSMADDLMVELVARALLNTVAPRPSIETLLHAFIPLDWVDHSHADAILALTNQPSGQAVVRDVFAEDVGIVPYIKPGFLLSKAAADVYDNDPSVVGLILENHGLVTFGESARESYERHIELVSRAENSIRKVWKTPPAGRQRTSRVAAGLATRLRGQLSIRNRMILRFDGASRVRQFVDRDDVDEISQKGPVTPDHILRTKQLPMVLHGSETVDIVREINNYEDQYRGYVARCGGDASSFMHDPFPRVILAPGIGMFSTGRTASEADKVGEIYRHTMDVIEAASAIDRYQALPERDLYEIEYWPLELYKLMHGPADRELAGRVAAVTGAASGIGKSVARRLAADGAHVFVTDIDVVRAEQVAEGIRNDGGVAESMGLDVTDQKSISAAFRKMVLGTGGLDIVVSNAGRAEASAIHKLTLAAWNRSFDINATGHFLVLSEAVRWLRNQDLGGNLVLVCTKNTFDPGRDFGAYSAAKAAELQLGRVLAIENGEHNIRVNMVNPDAVFEESKLWSKKIREGRAAAHGVPIGKLENYYKDRNLLRTKITGTEVAEAVFFLASDRSAATTGAVIPVDGGVTGAFPR